MKGIFFYIIIGLSIIISCTNGNNHHKDDYSQMDCIPKERFIFESEADQVAICKYGDIKVYNKVKKLYRDYNIEREVLFYSFIMANRYHYVPAYYDVYLCLWQAFNGGKKAALWDMTRFDPKSREMALHYLKMGAKRGNKDALRILIKYYTAPVEYGKETRPLHDNNVRSNSQDVTL